MHTMETITILFNAMLSVYFRETPELTRQRFEEGTLLTEADIPSEYDVIMTHILESLAHVGIITIYKEVKLLPNLTIAAIPKFLISKGKKAKSAWGF